MWVALSRMLPGVAACVLTVFANTAFAQGYQTTLQISPPGGGRCVDVPNRQFVQGQGLQMLDCDNSPAQLFTYDPTAMRLSIGGLCVDAAGGNPGDLVRLWPCDGGPRQVWKAEPKGFFTKLAAPNGMCFDIRYGSTASGAPLQGWNCGDAEPNQLWSLQRR